MTQNRFHWFRLARLISLVAILSSAFAFLSSCELEDLNPDLAHLDVYVRGTLSFKPREGITVSLHNTEADADAGRNAITPSQNTDENGIARFRNLTPGQSYWVRAKAVVSKSVKETGTLGKGLTDFNISIL